MKTVLKKGSLSTSSMSSGSRPVSAVRPGTAARAPAARAPAAKPAAPANPYKLTPTKTKSNTTVWIVVGVVVAILGLIVIIMSSQQEPPRRAYVPPPVQEEVSQSGSEVGKPDPRLGGKTWAEASKEGAGNSKMMQARKSAMHVAPKR
ncbi:MAG: hypothetical protein WCN95_16810 [bacterium]